MNDDRPNLPHAPATARNREPILAVLRRVLPARGLVLEIAAGTGEHAAFFSSAFPSLRWQATDADPAALEAIAAWHRQTGNDNFLVPLALNVRDWPWPVPGADAIFNANMIHISPWEACLGLVAGAGRVLASGGLLILYGPYKVGGEHTAPSNAQFDQSLKGRDPRWGIRDLEKVTEVAAAEGLTLEEVVAMPANNQILLLRRT